MDPESAESHNSTSTPVNGAAPRETFQLVETEKLLRPLYPAREFFGEQHLQDLIVSLQAVGLLQPIVVEVEGEMFRIHAGDRRYHACKALGWTHIPAMVYPAGSVPGEAVKQHENAIREALNPAEEAKYLHRLLINVHQGDLNALAMACRQSPNFIAGRLALLEGDPRIFQALADDKIGVGVARELNKIIHDGYRMQYLQAAIDSGTVERVVRKWREEANANEAADPAAIMEAINAAEAAKVPPPPQSSCFFCNSSEDQHAMRYFVAHDYCKRMADERIAAQLGGPENAG